MTSNHFFDNQLAFCETLGANIGHWISTQNSAITIGAQSGRPLTPPNNLIEGLYFGATRVSYLGVAKVLQSEKNAVNVLEALEDEP